MKFYCVVCRRFYKTSATQCCTPESLLKYESKGFISRQENYYTLNAHPLTFAQVEAIRDRETSNYRVWQLGLQAEKMRRDINSLLTRIENLVDGFPRSSDTRYPGYKGAITENELQNTVLPDMLARLAIENDAQTMMQTLRRVWGITISLRHVRRHSHAWGYCKAADVFIEAARKAIAPSVAIHLQATNDIEFIVACLSNQKECMIDTDREYCDRIVEGAAVYMKTVLPNISDAHLGLVAGLRFKTVQADGRDVDDAPYTFDHYLCEPIATLASIELDRRKNQQTPT